MKKQTEVRKMAIMSQEELMAVNGGVSLGTLRRAYKFLSKAGEVCLKIGRDIAKMLNFTDEK